MARDAEHIGRDEADALFYALGRFAGLVIAVSGGPDSLALLKLLADWRSRLGDGGPTLVVATVDHGLRATSADEATMVAALSQQLGLPHTTLPWTGAKPKTGLQNAAREARYRLLAAYARQISDGRPVAVLTAHHAGDQAETLLMRLKRGSGVDGLAGMRAQRLLDEGGDVHLVRPLLGLPKARLIAVVREAGWSAVDDPMNGHDAYERVRTRRLLDTVARDGLTVDALAASAARLDDARDALDYADAAFAATLSLMDHDGLCASLDRAAFASGPPLLRQRFLRRLLDVFGGETPASEPSEIAALDRRLALEPHHTATLGGAMLTAGPKTVRIWREFGRMAPIAIDLAPGQSAVFDQRFKVWTAPDAPTVITVRALGSGSERGDEIGNDAGADPRAPWRNSGLPARALYAVPAFWAGAARIAVPSLYRGPAAGVGSSPNPGTAKADTSAAVCFAAPLHSLGRGLGAPPAA